MFNFNFSEGKEFTLWTTNSLYSLEIWLVVINWLQDIVSSKSVCNLLLRGHQILLLTSVITERIWSLETDCGFQ